MEAIDPTEPIERIDPVELIERIDPVELIDHRDERCAAATTAGSSDAVSTVTWPQAAAVTIG